MVELKLDIDHRRNYKKTKKWLNYRLRWVDYTIGGILPATITFHRTRKGFHVRIATHELKDIDNKDIVCIQACLQSDWLREIRNLNRIRTGMTTNWNILFCEKFTTEKVGVDGLNIKTKSKEKFVSKYVLEPFGKTYKC